MASGVAGCGRRARNASCGFRLHRLPAAGGGGHAEPPLLLRVGVGTVLLVAHARVEQSRPVSPFFGHLGPPQPGRLRHVTNGCRHGLLVGGQRQEVDTNKTRSCLFLCVFVSERARQSITLRIQEHTPAGLIKKQTNKQTNKQMTVLLKLCVSIYQVSHIPHSVRKCKDNFWGIILLISHTVPTYTHLRKAHLVRRSR